MTGGFVGAIIHEGVHAVLAIMLGQLENIGWEGGRWFGGPYVEFRAETRLRGEVIRKGPLVVALAAAAVVVPAATYSIEWIFSAAVVAGLLRTSPADLFLARSRQAAGE
jgi:hypothetical protein